VLKKRKMKVLGVLIVFAGFSPSSEYLEAIPDDP
jgi:hypothetical protein